MAPRRYTLYVLIIVCLLAGLATGREFFFRLGYLAGGVMICALLWAGAGIVGLKLKRRTRAHRAQVGRYLSETLELHPSRILPNPGVEVLDGSTLPGHSVSRVIGFMAPGKAYRWDVRTLCTRRGMFRLGPMLVRSSDPFGLFTFERRFDATSPLVVYPATVPIHISDPPIGRLTGGPALRRRTHLTTTNASGVREYVPGDSLNRIHWRSTARRERLMVKEFELDPLADIWLVIDFFGPAHREAPDAAVYQPMPTSEFGNEPFLPYPSTEEYAVTIAASLAMYFIHQGRAVGLVAYSPGRSVIQADRGPRQFTRILESLALASATGPLSLDQVLELEAESVARGHALIAITPSTDPSWIESALALRRRGTGVHAILIDPGGFGAGDDIEQVALLSETMGIQTTIVRRGDDLAQVLSI